MPTINERIQLVESISVRCDLIPHQALLPLGYQEKGVSDASNSIQQVIKFTPDLTISNINLPGLTGKDLMVDFTSQGSQTPLIVIAEKGQENDVFQAFWMSAYDYLWSARDVAIVSVVNCSLDKLRENCNHQKLDNKHKKVSHESERKLCDLTTIFAIGKAVLSIRDQAALLCKSFDAAGPWRHLKKGSMNNVCI